MHLQIPTTQVFNGTQIGILGTEETAPYIGEETTIQFIMIYHAVNPNSPTSWMDNTINDLYGAIELVVGAYPHPTVSYSSDGTRSSATFLFSSAVKGKLRNPRKFLKAMASKILNALEMVEKEREEEETKDHLVNY